VRQQRGGSRLATELADYLSTKGVPFRDAHGIVGQVVRHCLANELRLEDLAPEQLQRFSPLFGPDVRNWLSAAAAVRRRRAPGGTAPDNVRDSCGGTRGEPPGTPCVGPRSCPLARRVARRPLVACGVKSAPRPPEDVLPMPIADLRGTSVAGGIELRWARPRETVDGRQLSDLAGFHIERATGSAPARAPGHRRGDRPGPDPAAARVPLHGHGRDSGRRLPVPSCIFHSRWVR